MSNSYINNSHIFYPQNDNPHYTEQKVIVVAWEWLIETCHEASHSKQKLRSLLSTTSTKAHHIAYIIKDVLSMKQSNPDCTEYFEAING
jgi:hypothetical protein